MTAPPPTPPTDPTRHAGLPQAVLPSTRGWPLFDVAATRRLEAQALAAEAPHALMARAGHAVARLAIACAPRARSLLALAGPGNNGGDAVVAACALHARGWQAGVVLLADPLQLPADAAWALAGARALGLPITDGLSIAGPKPAALDADLLLDGLLGVGATRAPEGALADAIAALNASGRPVLAIDLPSGLHPDHGVPLGAQTVRARHTLSLLTLKPGLFTAEGRDHAGRVWLDTLGVAMPDSAMRLSAPAAASGGAAAPHASHKGRFGDVAVVGGAAGMVGAALLAARAALAAGAGRVFLATLDGTPSALDPAWPELMQRPVGSLLSPRRLATLTVAAGCGGGDAIAAVLPPLIAHAQRLLLDADALNAVAADAALATALAARGRRGRPTLLTPHPLEAARLLGVDAAEVQRDRVGAARALAARFGAVAVLKGSGSVIAGPDGRLRINPTGNALLAAAGTGDVLAGWAAGRWARDAGPALETAEAAVHAHGAVADRAAARADDRPALRASEVIDGLRSLPT
jgi:ADP-dependent NAD(P)H-hydrate dehydratase / NAD(P)H-hydrate epimerase